MHCIVLCMWYVAVLCMCRFVDTIPGVVECDEGLIPLSHDLNHEFEAVDQPCVAQPSVQGRLRSHSAFWLQELEPSPFVREVIEHGYRIPFIRLPDPVFLQES